MEYVCDDEGYFSAALNSSERRIAGMALEFDGAKQIEDGDYDPSMIGDLARIAARFAMTDGPVTVNDLTPAHMQNISAALFGYGEYLKDAIFPYIIADSSSTTKFCRRVPQLRADYDDALSLRAAIDTAVIVSESPVPSFVPNDFYL